MSYLSRAMVGVYSSLLQILRKRSSRLGVILILAFVVLMLLGPLIITYSPYVSTGPINAPPSLAHPFGTDSLGRDVLSQTISGAYPSMIIGLSAALGAVLLGLFVGVLAGYFSKLEGLLTGVADVIMVFPALPLMVLLGSIYPPTYELLTAIMILVLWPPIARSIRSQVLSVKKRPFVNATKLSGVSDFEIVFKIIIPEVGAIALAYFVLTVSFAIVLVSGLQFLGIGNPDVISWGSMLYFAQQFGFYAGDWWWILAPGLSITIVTTGFALIGFSVEEIMNPRLRL